MKIGSDSWTTSRLIDEVSLNLTSIKETIHIEDGKRITVHKYYHQAREKIYRIPLYRDLFPFVIHLSDLTEKVKNELDTYCKQAGKRALIIILKMAVMKIFENLDLEQTHTSVMKNLTLRLIK